MAVAETNIAFADVGIGLADRRRVLSVACCAHALHDGFTDLIYVLLPVWQTEFALSYAALNGALASLVLIGIALNGTVPKLVAPDRRERAFSLFYTGTIGGGAIAPVMYGLAGDAIGPAHAILVVAGVCFLTLALAVALAPSLRDR